MPDHTRHMSGLFIGFMCSNECCGRGTGHCLQTPQKIFLEFTGGSTWQE